jgi:hypothetical protein
MLPVTDGAVDPTFGSDLMHTSYSWVINMIVLLLK